MALTAPSPLRTKRKGHADYDNINDEDDTVSVCYLFIYLFVRYLCATAAIALF